METLLDGGNITVNIDEQIVFDQLEQNEDAVWKHFWMVEILQSI